MKLLEFAMSLALAWTALMGLARFTEAAREAHEEKTSFYKEKDKWRKWNSPG